MKCRICLELKKLKIKKESPRMERVGNHLTYKKLSIKKLNKPLKTIDRND